MQVNSTIATQTTYKNTQTDNQNNSNELFNTLLIQNKIQS